MTKQFTILAQGRLHKIPLTALAPTAALWGNENECYYFPSLHFLSKL